MELLPWGSWRRGRVKETGDGSVFLSIDVGDWLLNGLLHAVQLYWLFEVQKLLVEELLRTKGLFLWRLTRFVGETPSASSESFQ